LRQGRLHQAAVPGAPYIKKPARVLTPAIAVRTSEGIVDGKDELQALREQVTKEQVGRIQGAFASQHEVAVDRASGEGGAAYMYAANQLLVRDEGGSLQQAQRVLADLVTAGKPEDVIDGVKLIRFGPRQPGHSATSALEVAIAGNAALGHPGHEQRQVFGVNRLLTVAPETGPCPATEPEEVYFDYEPFPAVRTEDDGSDGSGARIYVADTGLLASAPWHSWLVGVEGGADPLDPAPGEIIKPYTGHGTFVAAVARCMAPNAYVYVSNVFETAGSALEADLVKDLDAALSQSPPYDIFNLSITTPSLGDLDMIGFEAWRAKLRQHPGVVCVVAAGNDGQDGEFWPAAFPEMVSVGALAADWRSRASFSNYGDWVKVYAPGRDLINAYAMGTYECQDPPYAGQLRYFSGMAKWSGTSFSTPLVAGLIAARKSRDGVTAREAADSMLNDALAKAIPGVGPIILPYDNAFKS
jgi:subtilisin family serine protease